MPHFIRIGQFENFNGNSPTLKDDCEIVFSLSADGDWSSAVAGRLNTTNSASGGSGYSSWYSLLMVTVGKIPTESETIATHWNI
jgi:hypothetical protein